MSHPLQPLASSPSYPALHATPSAPLAVVPASPDAPALEPNPRVRYVPSPDGTILVVGVTLKGDWVADYRCHIEEFDKKTVRAMELKVMQREKRLLRILK